MPPETVPIFTDVLVPDLILHPTFPAQPAFRPDHAQLDAHFRHSGWLRDRRRVYEALQVVFPGSTRTERFRTCGTNAWVIRNEENPEHYAIVSDHCRDRFCRPCAAFRGRVIAHNVKEYLRNRRYRFLTLTIKNTDLTLKAMVDKLLRSFGALRRTKIWNDRVTGGCAVLEVKPKDYGPGWHPHIHAIIEGKWLPLPLIRKHWLRITTDSFIVTIGDGKDAEKAARYVNKYITKPFDDGTTRTPARLLQAIEALHGRRLVMTFGKWRGQRLTEYHPSGVWVKICPLSLLRDSAAADDPEAIDLLAFLTHKGASHNLPRPDTPNTPTDAPPFNADNWKPGCYYERVMATRANLPELQFRRPPTLTLLPQPGESEP